MRVCVKQSCVIIFNHSCLHVDIQIEMHVDNRCLSIALHYVNKFFIRNLVIVELDETTDHTAMEMQ